MGYMPGTNGILNALEYYGFDVDTFVLLWEPLEEDYKNQWPQTKFIDIDMSWWLEHKPNKWFLRFADLIYAVENLTNYDVILIWGADVCPVNNFMEYFEIAHKMKSVIVGTNEHCRYLDPPFSSLSEEWPYKHHWTVPYADVPFFVPRQRFDLMEKVLEYQRTERCELSHMDGLNYAIRDLGIKPIVVPGELWVHNVPERIPLKRGNNKKKPNGVIHFDKSNTRLNSFHRRYWAIDLCKKYHPVNEISRANKMLFNQMWAWFNTDHRVQWMQGWQLWDGT